MRNQGTRPARCEPENAHQGWRRRGKGLANVALVLAVASSPIALATDYAKHADGLDVYLGVLPAELLRGKSDSNHLQTMHGGLPSASGSHHVVVSIYDASTRRPIEDASVEASVVPRGLVDTRRRMEPMKIGGTTTYGNFFPMTGTGPFTVLVTIRRAEQGRPVQVQFSYAHPK